MKAGEAVHASRHLAPTKRRLCLLLILAAASWAWALVADASPLLLNHKVEAEYWGAVSTKDGDASLSRFTVKPSARFQIGDHWQGELALRGEYASDRTGLGTVDTYSSASRPLIDDIRTRVEIDRALLTGRAGQSTLTLGKQTVPWGVLDGVQVTDRFDAVRRRDFVLTDVRPERIARWGVRLRTELRGIGIDSAIIVDPTATQLPGPEHTFAPLASRLRGGMPIDTPQLPSRVTDRDRYVADATAGIRLSRRGGDIEATVLALRGPAIDPVLTLVADAGGPMVLLDFPRRTLFGATLEGALGGAVWRLEVAHIPDQSVNVIASTPLATAQRPRWLAGAGADWNAPGGWFLNIQLGIDQVSGGDYTSQLHKKRHELG